MQDVKDLFVVSGNGALYQECMQEMANARKAKQQELARLVRQKAARNKELRQIGLIILICLIVVPLAVGLLLMRLT
jgi:hypothetical protein